MSVVNDRFFRLPRPIALLIGALIASAVVIAADALFVERHILVRWGERMRSANLPHIMLDGVLALLLFAGSMQVDPAALRSRAWTVLALATASVAVSTIIFALGFYGLGRLAGQPIPLAWCLVLGALLAPTDAIVVEQLLRRVPIPRSLRAVIAGESLLNDGAAVVLFFAALAIAQGETGVVGHGRLFVAVLIEVIGGGTLGWLAGIVAALASRRLHDPTAEVTVSLALALVAYRLAAALGISGPIAVVAAGLAYRHWTARHRTAPSEINTAWAVIDDIINTFLFMLMGFQVLVFHATLPGLMLLVVAFVLGLLARGFSVCVPVFMMPMSLHERGRAIAVLTWSGLRGGISIALALTLPDTGFKDMILMMCYGVVILSILIQGLLIPAVFRALYGTEGQLEPGP